ncbi:DUF948 domain-containing protein [Paenibacillus nasutitermitis]|uniref:DUF948 domain-containing protein n=1 Tax=Paenibacillus nasutitermitis TaxID=1652958 RepID=A0A916YQA1_9BACL|nr:DUF948 domain-containing protein [Paenibacillus nasutitermitis]GGD54220.1 hypothetical protein GCM10010911_09720 [Paenibacillus nasutitermitis]
MLTLWLTAASVAAFVMLVLGVLLWLRSVDRKLVQLIKAAEAMERHAGAAAAQTCELMEAASKTLKTVQRQLDDASGMLKSVQRIGETVDHTTRAISALSGVLSETTERYVAKSGGKYQRHLSEALDWAEVGYTAWQFWQTKRKENRNSSACPDYVKGHASKENQ